MVNAPSHHIADCSGRLSDTTNASIDGPAGLPSAGWWRGRRVLVTGHTGFKGSWLCHWLNHLGAHVHGLALTPEPNSHYLQSNTSAVLNAEHRVDLRDDRRVQIAVDEARPDVVLHLAAQALVRHGYEQPLETFATNVQGTAHLLQACRNQACLKAVVVVTTDKCYQNDGNPWPMRETDPLGGNDPYSASKACVELMTCAYAHSYLLPGGIAVATARAGNVVGGGDVCRDRLLPDLFRALDDDRPLILRHPRAVRPWQHVLDALSGYLVLAQSLVNTPPARTCPSYNFAPSCAEPMSVEQVAQWAARAFGSDVELLTQGIVDESMPEAATLRLDASRAMTELRWRAHLQAPEAIRWTVEWERAVRSGTTALTATADQIKRYTSLFGGDHGAR